MKTFPAASAAIALPAPNPPLATGRAGKELQEIPTNASLNTPRSLEAAMFDPATASPRAGAAVASVNVPALVVSLVKTEAVSAPTTSLVPKSIASTETLVRTFEAASDQERAVAGLVPGSVVTKNPAPTPA